MDAKNGMKPAHPGECQRRREYAPERRRENVPEGHGVKRGYLDGRGRHDRTNRPLRADRR